MANTKRNVTARTQQKRDSEAYTLTASGCNTSEIYPFESVYSAANYDLSIEVASSATKAQCEAFIQAMICGSATSNTIKALNGKPTVNIPVILRITYR